MLHRSLGRTFVLVVLALLLLSGQLLWAQSPPTPTYVTHIASIGPPMPIADWAVFRPDGNAILTSGAGPEFGTPRTGRRCKWTSLANYPAETSRPRWLLPAAFTRRTLLRWNTPTPPATGGGSPSKPLPVGLTSRAWRRPRTGPGPWPRPIRIRYGPLMPTTLR